MVAGRVSVNETEDHVRAKYEAKGYRVLHRGAPDFLLLKPGEKPRFSEAKSAHDHLTAEQEMWIQALRELGAECTVDVYPPPSPRSPKVLRTVHTIRIDSDVWRAVRVTAAQRGMKICELMELGAREYLAEMERGP